MKILVIGAGIAGLYKAYKLIQEGHDVEIFEKNECIGGQLKTLVYESNKEKYYFDIGPHISPRNHPVWNWMCQNVESIPTPQPIKVSLLLKKGLDLVFPPGLDLVRKIKLRDLIPLFRFIPFYLLSNLYKIKEKNLEDSLINAWGLKFYFSYLQDFISTFWKANPKFITNKYKARFSPPSIISITRKILQANQPSSKLKPTKMTYPYPKLGTGEVIKFMGSELQKRGVEIKTNCQILDLAINPNNFEVTYKYLGKTSKKTFDELNWSGSISELIKILNLKNFNDLLYRKLFLINVKINKKVLLPPQVHTSYIMSPNIIFHRIYEPKKISPYMAPDNKTSACLEITLRTSTYNEDTITHKALDQLKSIYNLKDNEVEHLGNFFFEEGYSLLRIDYQKRYTQFIEEIKNRNSKIYFIGRSGQFFPYNLNETLDSVDKVY